METYVVLMALAFGICVHIVSGQFFSNTGMVNLARIAMVYLIFGLTEMISLTCAGPDVSYPAIASLSAYVTANIFGRGAYDGSVILPLVVCILIGAACGVLNGVIMSRFNFPYLEIGGFSHRWPPLDVLRHEQPEVLNFGDCERLSSFCHHFSDRLKQFITLNPVVLPCEGEE